MKHFTTLSHLVSQQCYEVDKDYQSCFKMRKSIAQRSKVSSPKAHRLVKRQISFLDVKLHAFRTSVCPVRFAVFPFNSRITNQKLFSGRFL